MRCPDCGKSGFKGFQQLGSHRYYKHQRKAKATKAGKRTQKSVEKPVKKLIVSSRAKPISTGSQAVTKPFQVSFKAPAKPLNGDYTNVAADLRSRAQALRADAQKLEELAVAVEQVRKA